MAVLSDLPPPLHGGQFASTSIDAVPVILILGALTLYLWGVVRANRLTPRHRWPLGRTVAFIGGLAVTAVAVFSFIGVYDSALFWDHMIQHLLLIMVAAPLFAISSPLALTFRATTGEAHALTTWALRTPVARFFDNPLVAFALYAVVIPITHLTAWYNYTLTHESVHDTEHLVFLLVGYLFWRQVFGVEPSEHRMHPALKAAYLFIAVSIDTFVGLSLDTASHELFPAYTAMHRTWGPSLLSDLHTGGVIMWVGGDTLMFLALIPVVIEWVRRDERRAVRVDRELDAMLAGRGPGGTDQEQTPSRP